MDRDFSNVHNCEECVHCSTCRSYYGGQYCKPEPKEKEQKSSVPASFPEDFNIKKPATLTVTGL